MKFRALLFVLGLSFAIIGALILINVNVNILYGTMLVILAYRVEDYLNNNK